MKVLVVGGGGREHAIVRALARSRARPGAALRARQRRASPPTPSACPRSAPRTSTAIVAAARERGGRPGRGRPRGAAGRRASSTRSRRPGIAAFGPSAAAAELEGSKAFAKELMAEAGVPTAGARRCCAAARRRSSSSPRASYPAVLKADGLAAGKGVIICADRGRGARGGRRLLHRAALRRDRPSCSRSSSRARSSRCWRSATARTSSRWRRPRTTSGSSTATRGRTPAAWAATRRSPASAPAEVEEIVDAVHRPVVEAMARRGTPFHGVLYAGLMIGRRRPEGARVQLPLRRPRDPGGAAAAALRPASTCCLGARASRAGSPGPSAEFADDWAVTLVLASAGYPESSSKGDVISGLEEAAPSCAEVTHAGTARARRRDRHRGRPGPQRDRARARPRRTPAIAHTMRPSRITFDGMQIRTDIAARAVERVRRLNQRGHG